MPVQEIAFKDWTEENLTVTLKGDPPSLINALCNGLPKEMLEQLRDALADELQRRKESV